jgi:hypothetical protein
VGGNHLKFTAEGGPGVGTIDAIAFGQSSRLPAMATTTKADIVGRLMLNTWRGRNQLELHVADIAEAGSVELASDYSTASPGSVPQ